MDRPGAVPEGFWEQAAISATAASALAPCFGASAPEAFCLGLLHTIGSALLHQVHPVPSLCLPFTADPATLAQQEIDLYGYGHAEVGAQVLARWNFPPAMCALIADHHEDLPPDATALARVLQATRICADIILKEDRDRPKLDSEAEPVGLGALPTFDSVGSLATPSLLEQIREKAAPLQHSLTASA